MTTRESSAECAFCHNPATGRVTAQWSIFDWDYYDVCLLHVRAARVTFERKTVDGSEPVAITTRMWAA